MGAFGASLGSLGEVLGGLGGLSGTSWGPLGGSWGPLGGSLGPLGGLLGYLWGLFGSLGRTLGASWVILGTLCAVFGVTWGVFGAFWEPSGCQKAPKRLPRASRMSKKTLPERIAFSSAFPCCFGAVFQCFVESRAQVRVCRNCTKHIGFYMFFACRLFLERVGSHKQRSAQISLKNIGQKAFNTQKIGEKTRSGRCFCALGSFGDIFVPRWL